MRIAIATVQIPFVKGGAEILTDMLKDELIKRGYDATVVSIPFKYYPQDSLIKAMNMGRMMDLTESNGEKIDKVIAMKFPAYYCRCHQKVFWLMHQHRDAYDLWGTNYGNMDCWPEGNGVRRLIMECDNKYLLEGKRYTIAANTSARLKKYNQLDSTVLYHPPLHHEKLYCADYGDFIFYPSRICSIKRQSLLVEAAKYIKSGVKIILAGGAAKSELDHLMRFVQEERLENKVKFVGFISEEEKIEYYANCLAVYFGAFDEDYGYITLEGLLSEKPVIVHRDSGGPLEFINDNVNGFVVDPDPHEIAKKIDELYDNRSLAERLGKAGKQSLLDKHMDWDYVIDKLVQN